MAIHAFVFPVHRLGVANVDYVYQKLCFSFPLTVCVWTVNLWLQNLLHAVGNIGNTMVRIMCLML